MRTELIELHNRLKTTFVDVTHVQTEAMSMGTRIILMNKGVIQHVDNPVNIYRHPVNLFTATFMGQSNLVRCSLDGKKGAIIGAAAGTVAGATAGTLIGRKMDKAKAAAAAVANAEAESIKDGKGLDAVKVTFDNGILFAVGKATLTPKAQSSLKQFADNVLNVYTDCDVAICGFASSDGSDATNLTLSQGRASAVKNYLTGTCGVSNAQIKSTDGYGEDPQYLIFDANGKEDRNASRRVEVYLYASDAMIAAANAGTLK
jgi:outer membrane protein OmpA-like peptidoglycan-associated protein